MNLATRKENNVESYNISGVIAMICLLCVVAMFSSCTYHSVKDHNACVVASKTVEIAKQCQRAS